MGPRWLRGWACHAESARDALPPKQGRGAGRHRLNRLRARRSVACPRVSRGLAPGASRTNRDLDSGDLDQAPRIKPPSPSPRAGVFETKLIEASRRSKVVLPPRRLLQRSMVGRRWIGPDCWASTHYRLLKWLQRGWLGSSREERATSPQRMANWGLAALAPSHPRMLHLAAIMRVHLEEASPASACAT